MAGKEQVSPRAARALPAGDKELHVRPLKSAGPWGHLAECWGHLEPSPTDKVLP